MNKTELEEAIKNGDSVWAYNDFLHKVIPYKANEIAITGINTNMPAYELKDLFATKQQAEHYLHHANITRTEQLPFLTWEEFLEKKEMYFLGYNENVYKLSIYEAWIWLENAKYSEMVDRWSLSETNFYKAYDECVRLFKGEE